ncbi:unnamed protein product, partial [marine sediment metagenome]
IYRKINKNYVDVDHMYLIVPDQVFTNHRQICSVK